MSGIRLQFNGQVLALITEGGEFHFPATSGELGVFQEIPEGQYWIKLVELSHCTWIRSFTPPQLFNSQNLGGSKEWEKLQITLQPDPKTVLNRENPFFIGREGGGAKNCIRLMGFHEFVSLLKLEASKVGVPKVTLKVDYQGEPKQTPQAPSQEPKLRLDMERLKEHVPIHILKQISSSPDAISEITNKLRLAHFLAQCAHESGNFRKKTENMYYKTEDRLIATFKKRFDLLHPVKDYIKNPKKLGNYVYGSRLGNGDEQSGDGYNYRGRGYIQLTGKENYEKFSKYIGDDQILKHPELVATKYPLDVSLFFFKDNQLWEICDKGSKDKIVKAVTAVINTGCEGLEKRQTLFKMFYKILTDGDV